MCTIRSGQVRSFLLQALQRTTHTNQAGSTLESQHTAHSTHAYTSYDCPPRIFVRARTSQRLISRLYTPHTTRTTARRRRFSEPHISPDVLHLAGLPSWFGKILVVFRTSILPETSALFQLAKLMTHTAEGATPSTVSGAEANTRVNTANLYSDCSVCIVHYDLNPEV